MLIVNPVAAHDSQPRQSRRALDSLEGKVVGFIDDAKPNFNHLVDDLAELLIASYGVSKVVKRRKRVSSYAAPEAMIDELAQECDVVITGSGD
jgi:hypothetical protein